MSTADRIARLPQWAQMHIRSLETRRQEAEARLQEALGIGPEDTDTVINPYADEPIRLPAGAAVRFGHGPRRQGWIDVRWRRDGTAEVLAGGRLSIEPHVTNHVTLRVIDK